MSYKHGVYSEKSAYSGGFGKKAIGTIPVYIGTAPIHQLNTAGAADFDYSKYINKPMLINSLQDARKKIGYSTDFESFTLCEAVAAHFNNGVEAVGPIIVINIFNPANVESSNSTETITFTGVTGNKVGYITDSKAAIENITIGSLTTGDYKLSYENGKIKVNVTKEGYSSTTTTASFARVDTSDTAISVEAFTKGLEAMDICEVATGEIPNILAAPKYSKKPAYYVKMIEKAVDKISGKWNFTVVSDIVADSTVNTVDKAIAWKETNGHDSKFDKVCFPKVSYNGAKYHLSTMAVVTMQSVDTDADGVPYISPSNKVIYADATILDDGTEILLTEPQANKLNEAGITSVNIIRGKHRLWGVHNANYSYANESNIDPDEQQDAGIRMGLYLMNKMQYDYIDTIDTPINRKDIDGIISKAQQWLNGLVNDGALLYGTVAFNSASNPADNLVVGDFVFDVQHTTAPNGKSLTFRLQYTEAGLATLTQGE